MYDRRRLRLPSVRLPRPEARVWRNKPTIMHEILLLSHTEQLSLFCSRFAGAIKPKQTATKSQAQNPRQSVRVCVCIERSSHLGTVDGTRPRAGTECAWVAVVYIDSGANYRQSIHAHAHTRIATHTHTRASVWQLSLRHWRRILLANWMYRWDGINIYNNPQNGSRFYKILQFWGKVCVQC